MLGLSIEPRKISIRVLQHRILIAVPKLTAQRAILRPALTVVSRSIVLDCTLAHSFIGTICCRGIHHGLLLCWLRIGC